jgi:hypothetical protein
MTSTQPMTPELIQIASVSGGKFHYLADQSVTRDDGWKPRLMLCGRTLEPLNYFLSESSADKYTGGRFAQHVCSQCKAKVTL